MGELDKIFQIVFSFYIIAFLFFLIKFCLRVWTIVSLRNEACNIFREMKRLNPPTRNVDNNYLLTFNSTTAWRNQTRELATLKLKYQKWCYKLGRIQDDFYSSRAQNFGHMENSLVNFINLSPEYCRDEWAEIFKNTFLAPSKILKYVGMPINFISKALDVLIGLAGLYPLINKIWRFIAELLQKIPH